jgi:hypothetical protein
VYPSNCQLEITNWQGERHFQTPCCPGFEAKEQQVS